MFNKLLVVRINDWKLFLIVFVIAQSNLYCTYNIYDMHVLCAAYKDIATSILQGKTRVALGINMDQRFSCPVDTSKLFVDEMDGCVSEFWCDFFRKNIWALWKLKKIWGDIWHSITNNSKIGHGSGSIFWILLISFGILKLHAVYEATCFGLESVKRW